MTSAWTFPGKWYAPVGRKISELVIQRLARVYDITITPPMPPTPQEMAARTAAIRELVNYARKTQNAMIAITPEGQDFPGAILGDPPPGSGRLMRQFARMGFTILPAAIYEENGELHLNFGIPYSLKLPHELTREEVDRTVSRLVMERIAALLPPALQGKYHAPVEPYAMHSNCNAGSNFATITNDYESKDHL